MQNNDQLYHGLKNSPTASGTAKIITNRTKYHIVINPCRDLIFNILLQKAIIDTRATASTIRENLYSLDTYIAMIKYDIVKFNEYAKIKYEALPARGDRCDNMMSNLFKGYLVVGEK